MAKTALFLCLLMMTQTAGAASGGIVIDPGHSPHSPGATSCTGKLEYLYNAALANFIAVYLSSRHIPVSITRNNNEELPLADRAKLTKGERLFLSIHHDSVQPQFIAWKKHHPCSDKAEGYSIFISSKNRHYVQSLHYAQRLGVALRGRGLKPSQHHGEKNAGENKKLLDVKNGIYLFDDLVVLKKTDAPAILFEAAVIVSPQDEAKAESKVYKAQIASAIADMLEVTPTSNN